MRSTGAVVFSPQLSSSVFQLADVMGTSKKAGGVSITAQSWSTRRKAAGKIVLLFRPEGLLKED